MPESSPNPLNVYGKSKLAGEEAVQKAAPDFLIVRSGWIYASHGRNFLLTILSALRAGRPLKVVDDQVGVPTAARSLARAVWACAMQPGTRGIRHWVDRGTASWYDFAVEIQRIATELSLIAESPQITPVTSVEYERPARRPAYSVLDAEMLWRELGAPATWQSELRQTLSELFSGTA